MAALATVCMQLQQLHPTDFFTSLTIKFLLQDGAYFVERYYFCEQGHKTRRVSIDEITF